VAFMIILRLADREATNVTLMAAVPAILMFVATVACWYPSWRATKRDPLASLREQ
jgi:ABC-type lipoprotein release transport system permease subunit